MTYQEQIKDPRWQKKKLPILSRDEFMCQSCGDEEEELQVHHIIYYQDRMIWDYKDNELISLCSTCHKNTTEEKKNIKQFIDNNFVYIDTLKPLKDIICMLAKLDPSDLDGIKNYICTKYLLK